jgi:hypothetical protein
MKNTEVLNVSKRPIVKLNSQLNKYESAPLFQDKLDIAKDILSKTKLPFSKDKNDVIKVESKVYEKALIRKYYNKGFSIQKIAGLVEMQEAEIVELIAQMKLSQNS